MSEPTEMYVITGSAVQTDADGRPISVRGFPGASETVKLSMESLKAQMASFMQGINALMKEVEQKAGTYYVNEVEIAVSIGADGKIALLGNGAGVEASASFKIILKKE